MSRPGYERLMRLTHRWLAVGAGAFFFLSLVTGLLWADARFLYWDEHYKEKLRAVPGPPVDAARVGIPQAIEQAKAAAGGRAIVEQVLLRSDFGRLLYEVRLQVAGRGMTVLLDALTGDWVSPISTELAPVIAAQYLPEPAVVVGVDLERYTPRKKKRAYDAVRVRFDDANRTEIVLDRQTGEILEDEGRWRKLHFLVMQLHQLNFFGFEKTLLNVPGVPLFLMGLSGIVLWGFHRSRVRRTKLAQAPGDSRSQSTVATASRVP